MSGTAIGTWKEEPFIQSNIYYLLFQLHPCAPELRSPITHMNYHLYHFSFPTSFFLLSLPL